jgi:histidinol-phosphate aminotransferase
MKSAAGSASITYLANPNNPTGIVEKQSEIRRLCEAARGSVVVDEANGEFDDSESCLGLIHDIPNLIVLRTFSKAYGLACLRVGYCAANEQIIAQLEARSPRFPVSGLSARIALIGLNDDNHIQRTVEHVGTQTKMLVAALRSRGIWCSASTANCFVMHLPPQLGSGPDFLAFCAENGISLVPGEEFGLSKNHFRVAPQLNEGSAALIAAIDTFVHTRIHDSS